MSEAKATIDALSKEFDRAVIKMKPGSNKRPAMPYVSHGSVTKRFNAVCPDWSSRVVAMHTYMDQQGRMQCVGVTLELTIPGVGSREEFGAASTPRDFGTDAKNAMSDALKRCAMRFGVAIDLWEDMDEDNDPEAARFNADPPATPARQSRSSPQSSTASTRPAAAPTAAGPSPSMTDDELLASISNVNLDPDARWAALWDYYERATTVAELNTRADVAYNSGMPTRDLKSAYKQSHDRLSKLFAPIPPPRPNPHPPEPPHSGDQASQRSTERQIKFIYAIAKEAGLDEQELAAWSLELYQQDVDQLNRRDAATLIEALQRRRNEVA